MPDVSIIIPTYNEAETIEQTVDDVREHCRAWGDDQGASVEVLVVDDDSPDETWRLVDELGYDDVDVLRRTEDPGLAPAVIDGFREAGGGVLLVMDADGQHPPAALPRMLAPFDAVDGDRPDLVIGSRFVDGGGIDGWSRTRRVISWGGARVADLSVGRSWRVSDPMSGFFAVRADVVDGRLDDLDPTGYKILLEVIARCRPERVVEVGFVFEERRAGESKLDSRESLRFLAHALGLGSRQVDAVDAAVLSVGALWLVTAAVSTAVSVGLFAAAAAIVVVRSGQNLGEELQAVDVETMEGQR